MVVAMNRCRRWIFLSYGTPDIEEDEKETSMPHTTAMTHSTVKFALQAHSPLISIIILFFEIHLSIYFVISLFAQLTTKQLFIYSLE